MSYWPILKDNLYSALGLSPDGKPVSDQGLIGPNVEKYQTAFEALRLINIEFLSRCCGRVSRMMTRPEKELKENAEVIEKNVRALSRLKVPDGVVTLSNKERGNSTSRTFSSDRDCRAPHVHSRRTKGEVRRYSKPQAARAR